MKNIKYANTHFWHESEYTDYHKVTSFMLDSSSNGIFFTIVLKHWKSFAVVVSLFGNGKLTENVISTIQ